MQTSSSSQQDVTDYFESTAAYWKAVYSDDRLLPVIYRDRHHTALGWIRDLNLRPNARILEVGCGAGLITVALAGSGYVVDALDSATAMLQMTRDRAAHYGVQDRVRIHTADVHALPFQSDTFDLVIAIGVVPWLHSERLALQEMRRVLRPGGALVVTADNNARLNRILDPRSSPLSAWLRLLAKRLLRTFGWWSPSVGFQPKRHFPREFDRCIGECGFESVKSCTVGFGPFTFLGQALFTEAAGVKLHRWLQAFASTRGWSFLRWSGSHYLVLVTRA